MDIQKHDPQIAAYAHVFLFQCPNCGLSLSAARLSQDKSLEEAEAGFFKLACECGWSTNVPGFTAVKHWVEEWDVPAPAR